MRKLIVISAILFLALSVPSAWGCWPECSDDQTSHVSGGFNGYDESSMDRDAGTRGVTAFAAGSGAGSFEANAEGKNFAHTFGGGRGYADTAVGAAGGEDWVAVGGMSSAHSSTYAGAISDGGHRDAYAAAYGGVYQNNGAYLDKGNGTWAAGGNESGANYLNEDSSSYDGFIPTRRGRGGRTLYPWKKLNGRNAGQIFWKPFRVHPPSPSEWELVRICFPGANFAGAEGGAFTAGGTVLYADNYEGGATVFGATGSLSVGNDGVFGNGAMETSAFAAANGSSAGAYTSGTYSYSGNNFGAGVTFGGSTVSVGDGYASVHASHTSMAFSGGGNVDRPE